MLVRRTNWFADAPRTVAGIDAFKERVERTEPQVRPLPKFHHCPFLGIFVDTGRRVGYLLHPLAHGNDGLDWRGLSYYGGMAGRTYFCPCIRKLPARWLTACVKELEKRIGKLFERIVQKRGKRKRHIPMSERPTAGPL
jgi:hypothetical protein